ncbi:MAG: arginine deiminase family protein [Candidatus Krumholzibacteriia bacterium]
MTTARVTSEVGRLRQVLVHEPGPEVDRMVPSMMEELLFDDILFGDAAREEHRRFQRVLQLLGVEVLEMETLLQETLRSEEGCRWILDPLLEVTPKPLRERMQGATPEKLAAMLVHGVRLDPLHAGIEADDLFEVPPLPNLCFQRDPQAIIGSRVIISSMATPARWREALLAGAIFRFHPRLSRIPILLDPMAPGTRPIHLGPRRPQFEGGDVLVLSPDVVALGYSERTNRTGVHHLARVLARLEGGPRWLVVVKLPARRAYMHLDTVITPVNRDACLVYPPITMRGGSDAAHVFEIDLHSEERAPVERDDLLAVLAKRGVDLKPIPCGGSDPVVQQREQWTDGANAFAVAPGMILLYERNPSTAEQLDREGFRIVRAEDLLLGREQVDVGQGERAGSLLPSHEMSRARGGPHGRTQPLLRDEVT